MCLILSIFNYFKLIFKGWIMSYTRSLNSNLYSLKKKETYFWSDKHILSFDETTGDLVSNGLSHHFLCSVEAGSVQMPVSHVQGILNDFGCFLVIWLLCWLSFVQDIYLCWLKDIFMLSKLKLDGCFKLYM